MPPEVNPRAVFERLFGTEDLSLDPETRARRMRYRKSILDMAREDTRKLVSTLGPVDRRKIDEYLTSVREIERRIAAAEKQTVEITPGIEKPAGIPVSFLDYAKLMFDLSLIAFQTDMTRITTIMPRSRRQQPRLSRDRNNRPASSLDASPQQCGLDREGEADKHASY